MSPGTVIAGRYRLERLLGQGGMGAVYKARDLQTQHVRALKLMLDHRLGDAGARARFAREAAIAGRIESPYVVDVIDSGVDAEHGTPYLVMELLEGEDLAQRLARLGPRPAAEVVEDLAQVARALQRMHARDVVHRDLKPSNLFREHRDGAPPRIKVLDLGIAKVLSLTGGDTTGIVGSVPYMAPEQIQGRAISPATDLYALGLIAFTLLSGVPYWTQDRDEQSIALAMRIVDGPQDPASKRARDAGVELTPELDAWFARATARQPSRRFRSAAAAVRALAGALGVEPPPWLEDEPEPPAPADDGVPPDAPASGSAAAERTLSASWRDPGLAPAALDRLPSPSRPRPWWRIAASVALGAVLAAWPRCPQPPESPLAAPGSVLACPVLEVDGDVRESGWLGAAAGSLACERARVVLGGLTSRTQVPAELLALRSVEGFDDDPYGSADARGRSLVAARRSDAYLDGRVARLGAEDLGAGFRVELVLRRADATEVKRASGQGKALYQAVRAAMDRLIAPDAIPRARRPDPTVADYSRARDVDTLLRLLDWTLAMANNAGGIEAECAWFASADEATDLASFVRYICAHMRGYSEPTITLPQAATPGARAARARIDFLALKHKDPAAVDELRRLYDAESSTWGKSVIAASLSCLLQPSSRDEARTWGWRAVSEPKNPTGEWCAPWGQLMSVADDTSSEEPATIQWRVWVPWESYAWWFAARNTKDPARALTYARRAYLLSPLDTNVASELASRLLRDGQSAGVANIAARFAESHVPVHRILSMLLTVRFDASEARFGQALATARDAMRVQHEDTGWALAQRLENAWRAVEIANVLGRASEVADVAVAELVDREPAVLDWAVLDTPRYVTAICAYASPPAAQRCFARLNALGSPLTPSFARGAQLFAAGDHRGAARAWLPLVRNADEHVDLLAEAMVRALTAAGEHELAIEIEARTRGTAALFDGANMAMARIAQAMHARGDEGAASRLARLVLDAWKHADPEPPILDEMRRLAR